MHKNHCTAALCGSQKLSATKEFNTSNHSKQEPSIELTHLVPFLLNLLASSLTELYESMVGIQINMPLGQI
jgi:hypothetical protein